MIHSRFEEIDCPSCGVIFYVNALWLSELQRRGGSGHCPNGHSWSFKVTETDKLRQERDRLKQRLAEKDDEIKIAWNTASDEKRKRAAVQGHLTKAKKRISAGVCPCCNRSFVNLKRHMASKHPKFMEQEPPGLEVIAGGKK